MTRSGSIMAAGVAAALMVSSAARGATYDFTFTGGADDPTVRATGTFTTNAANDAIVSGSGIFSFDANTDEAATLVPGNGQIQDLTFDNVFPIDASNGILFQGETDKSFVFNIYAPTETILNVGVETAWASAQDGGGFLYASLSYSGACSNCTAVGSLTIGVPEASTWAMLGLGFAALGFAGWRRSHTARAISL